MIYFLFFGHRPLPDVIMLARARSAAGAIAVGAASPPSATEIIKNRANFPETAPILGLDVTAMYKASGDAAGSSYVLKASRRQTCTGKIAFAASLIRAEIIAIWNASSRRMNLRTLLVYHHKVLSARPTTSSNPEPTLRLRLKASAFAHAVKQTRTSAVRLSC